METVESCRSWGIVPGDLFRVPLAEVRVQLAAGKGMELLRRDVGPRSATPRAHTGRVSGFGQGSQGQKRPAAVIDTKIR